jgi:hypothetical protein
MSWQAFSWTEIQARSPRLADSVRSTSARATDALALLGAFLTPFAVMEAALGIWRLGDDFGWAGPFFINRGVLSHWQVWFALAAFTQATSVYLNRLLSGQDLAGKQK